MEKIALLVLSCDKYSDLWPSYFTLLNKYWPDCPFKIYLQTNFYDFDSEANVTILKVGKDKSWSDGLIKSINQLQNYDYVLLMMEDMFLNKQVETDKLLEVIHKFIELNGSFITLINEPIADKTFNDYFGTISPGAMYRATATAALWKKQVLLDILDPLETAWQFEKIASKRTDIYTGFYSVKKSYFNFFHGVVKGKWTLEAVSEFKRLGMEVDLNQRNIFSPRSNFGFRIYKFFRKVIINIIPFRYRRLLLRKN